MDAAKAEGHRRVAGCWTLVLSWTLEALGCRACAVQRLKIAPQQHTELSTISDCCDFHLRAPLLGSSVHPCKSNLKYTGSDCKSFLCEMFLRQAAVDTRVQRQHGLQLHY